MSILEIEGLESFYGRIKALHGITFQVNESDVVTIIGSNGAGKSTLLNTIAGIKMCDYGTISFCGHRTDNLDADRITKLGLSLVPEGRRVFGDLTVMENLKMGAFLRKDRKETEKLYDYVFNLFPILKTRASSHAKYLSGGEQQMLSIGRALMNKPRLIMFDEPSLGLSPLLVKEIFRVIKEINKIGTSVLMVEQNVMEALKIANYAYVLLLGNLDKAGTPEELLEDEEIRTSYLGEGKYVDRKELWKGKASTRK